MYNNMAETPGGVYALAYWMACLVYISVNKKRKIGSKIYFVALFFLISLVTYMTLHTNVPMIFFVPSIIITIVALAVFIYICCDFSLKNVIYFTVRAFILGEFMASFGWQIYYFLIKNLNFKIVLWETIILLVIMDNIFCFVMYFMEKKYVNENKSNEITRREVISAFIIGCVIFILSNLSFVHFNTPFSGRAASEIFNVRTLVDFGGVALLFAYHMQIAELNMKFEVEKLKNLLNMQIANYQMSEKSIDMLNQKHHDLKHQISLLKSGNLPDESYAYLDIVEKEIKSYEAQNKTGNKILDTVIMGKQLYCQSMNIDITCIADGAALNFFDPIDISTLFGNVLDNAIESVLKIHDMEKKLIHINISKAKGFLRIKVENCYEGVIKYKNGLPITTKQDKNNHGYGLKSILSTVKKYNGSLTIGDDAGWFEVRILIPIITLS